MPNNNSDSLVDRILRGDFTQELNSEIPEMNPEPDGLEDDTLSLDEDEIAEDEELDEEEDDDYSADPDADFPSDEYCEEYMEENGIESVPEPAAPVGAKYTKFRDSNDNPNSAKEQPKVNMMKNTINNSESQESPKNSSTPTPATEGTTTTKRRGRPSKLVGHEAEVVRLYGEGVSTKLISEKFSCSISSVINCLRAQNVEIRPKGRRKGS